MKHIQPFLAAVLLLALALCLVAAPAGAVFTGEVDLNRSDCSITLELGDGSGDPEKDLIGGEISLYLVAGISDGPEGCYYDTTAGAFAGSAAVRTIPTMSSAELESANAAIAAALERECGTRAITPLDRQPIKNSGVKFENLKVGLYLLSQTQASDRQRKITPFLLSVPSENDGSTAGSELEYHVTATPKAGYYAPPPTPTPVPPTPTPTPPPKRTNLPQTGQLWWPVPVMGLLGIGMIACGLVLRRKEKRASDD